MILPVGYPAEGATVPGGGQAEETAVRDHDAFQHLTESRATHAACA
jgi:hypothetical protein